MYCRNNPRPPAQKSYLTTHSFILSGEHRVKLTVQAEPLACTEPHDSSRAPSDEAWSPQECGRPERVRSCGPASLKARLAVIYWSPAAGEPASTQSNQSPPCDAHGLEFCLPPTCAHRRQALAPTLTVLSAAHIHLAPCLCALCLHTLCPGTWEASSPPKSLCSSGG